MAERSDFRGGHAASSTHEHPKSAARGEHHDRERDLGIERRSDQSPAFNAEAVAQMVDRYPYASLLTGIGLGFGLGLALTMVLPRRRQSWFEEYVPESMQNLPEQLKRVPETVASYLPRSWRHS